MNAALPKQRSGQLLSLAVVLVPAGILYLALAWTDQLAGHGGDGATYLLIARHYAGVGGGVAQEYAASTFYPPLYPWLLTLLGGAESMLVANLVTTIFMLIAFALLFAYANLRGLQGWLPLLAVAIFVAAPANYLQTMMAQSENLYAMLTFAALTCAVLFERRGSTWDLAGLAVAAAAAALCRSAGLAMLVALFAFALRRGSRIWLAALAAAAPALLWHVVHSGAAGYETHLVAHLPSSGGGWETFVQGQARAWLVAWPSIFGVSTHGGLALAWSIGALGVGGAAHRALKLHFDGLYIGAYLAMSAAWPYPAEAQRLLLVVAPLIAVEALHVLQMAARHAATRWKLQPVLQAALPATVAAALLLAMLPALAIVIARYRDTPPEHEAYRHLPEWYGPLADRALQMRSRDAFVAAMKSFADLDGLRDDDCIYAIKPTLVAFYSGHRGIAPPGEREDAASFDEALRVTHCRFLLMTSFTSPSYQTPFYPLTRVQDRIRVLTSYPGDPGDPARILALVARFDVPAHE